MGADFDAVNAAALEMAPQLLAEWLGGKREGVEWVGERRANGGLGDSWKVNLNTGVWGHFGASGPGSGGGDMVSLYAALNHLDQLPAMRQVASLVGVADRPARMLNRSREAPAAPVAPEQIPPDAPPPPAHPIHGEATATYAYGRAFLIARYETLKGKTFLPWRWRKGTWWNKGYPAPKPLYGAQYLHKHPDAPILIVEGEKCADMANKFWKNYHTLTWAGGAKAVAQSDWSVLKGRDILIWPDADEVGRAAAAQIASLLSRVASRVRIIDIQGEPEGWDIGDAIGEGWSVERIAQYSKERVRTVHPSLGALAPAELTKSPALLSPEAQIDEASAFVSWQSLGLDTNEGGVPHPTLANASLILQMHPRFKGHVWFDEFTKKIYHNLKGSERQWRDEDDEDLTVFIQQSLRLAKFTLTLINQSVRHAARRNARNSLTDWLDSLAWDGIDRLDTWLADTLGVDSTAHTLAVSRNWPISMVARAYVPGCQVDTMPVLEGVTGLRKSSFVNILGAPWYASLPEAFGTKDFLQAVQGRWVIEIPDMTGFSHREHTHILATITNRTDVYRASYGHYVEEHPRSCVFAATSETEDYLQDIRGRRRYWPLRCKHIDLDVLRAQREQIFAQAVREYRAGSPWWDMPAETDVEQRQRAIPDIWTDKVIKYVEDKWDFQERSGSPSAITSADILEYGLFVATAKQGQIDRNRIARIMRENGWIQSRTTYQRHWIKIKRLSGLPPEQS